MSGLQEVLNKYAKEGREGGTAKETLQQECPSFEDSLFQTATHLASTVFKSELSHDALGTQPGRRAQAAGA